ncbi:MAG: hypothetical protein ACUVR8_12395 [Acidobacteriota bacterium]
MPVGRHLVTLGTEMERLQPPGGLGVAAPLGDFSTTARIKHPDGAQFVTVGIDEVSRRKLLDGHGGPPIDSGSVGRPWIETERIERELVGRSCCVAR